jgi:hypothetical protein
LLARKEYCSQRNIVLSGAMEKEIKSQVFQGSDCANRINRTLRKGMKRMFHRKGGRMKQRFLFCLRKVEKHKKVKTLNY